jgi:hypothetical protein
VQANDEQQMVDDKNVSVKFKYFSSAAQVGRSEIFVSISLWPEF